MQVSPPAVKLQYTLKESPEQPWLGSIQYSPTTNEKICALYSRKGIQKNHAFLLPDGPPEFVRKLFYLNGLGQGAKPGAICILICMQRCLHGAGWGCSWHKQLSFHWEGFTSSKDPLTPGLWSCNNSQGWAWKELHPKSIQRQWFLKSAILIRMMRVLISRCFTNRAANNFLTTTILIQFQTNSGGSKRNDKSFHQFYLLNMRHRQRIYGI